MGEEFEPVCKVSEVSIGEVKRFAVNGGFVAVYRLEDGFFATQCQCPHMESGLHLGKILDGHKVQCWNHRAVFDIRTGKVIKWANHPPGIQTLSLLFKKRDLITYPTRVEGEQVYVQFGGGAP